MMELVTRAAPPDALVEHAVRIGGSELVWLRAEPFAVRCEPDRTDGVLKLVVAFEGRGLVRQAEREAALAQGTFTWLHSDVAFELAMTYGRRLLLRVPEDQVRRRHPGLDVRTAVARGREHPGERIVVRLLLGLAQDGPGLSAAACGTAVNAVMEAVGLGPTTPVLEAAALRVERALASIERSLGEPALQAADIAREQGVSRRYLDGLLQQAIGRTLADAIRLRRLDRAAQDLLARPEDLTAEVAMRWGFRDASHFTRVFRRRFGVTPTAYRQCR